MNRRYLVTSFIILGTVVAASFALPTFFDDQAGPLESDQTYPAGAGPDQINFTALNAGDSNLTHTPRSYWDSYAIRYTAPPDRRLIEGEYYINSATGEIIADRWDNATVYRNGTVYAFFQPAESLPEHQREQFASDSQFVYENTTDAYYRYDPYYGQIAPTNIGRHTILLDSYTWEAVNTTTHRGVPVIIYRATGVRSGSQAPPPINTTLQLGIDDGIVYRYDLTQDADEGPYHYTYSVEPASFPDHEWVNTARDLASTNDSRSDR